MIRGVAATTRASRSASELRIVIGQLVRRLRTENSFSVSQATVLARLQREGPQTTSALAAAERVRPQSMAHTIAELQAGDFIARRPHPLDRRQILIELTDQGHKKLIEDRQRREGWLAQAIATELSPEEQAILNQVVPLIRRLAQS
jgi:DNA-binding MarR family transcriptional regulator